MQCSECGKDLDSDTDALVCKSCHKVTCHDCEVGWRLCDWCSREYCPDCAGKMEYYADWRYMCPICKQRLKDLKEKPENA